MAGSDVASPGASLPTVSRVLPLHRRLTFAAFVGLLAIAVIFYLWWGLFWGRWLDNGVYAVTIVLALFGLAGMWLVLPNPPAPPPPHP